MIRTTTKNQQTKIIYIYIYIYILVLHRDQHRGGTRVCDRGVACYHPNPTEVPSAAYIVVQRHRLADRTYSGTTVHPSLEAPTSVKLSNQMHWSHFGE